MVNTVCIKFNKIISSFMTVYTYYFTGHKNGRINLKAPYSSKMDILLFKKDLIN